MAPSFPEWLGTTLRGDLSGQTRGQQCHLPTPLQMLLLPFWEGRGHPSMAKMATTGEGRTWAHFNIPDPKVTLPEDSLALVSAPQD